MSTTTTCDVCGVKNVEMRKLNPNYVPSGIQECCVPCERILTDKLDDLNLKLAAVKRGWMVRFVQNLIAGRSE